MNMRFPTFLLAFLLFSATSGSSAFGQATELKRGSDNMEVLGHVPLGKTSSVTDMELEQELSRPYAYVSRASIVDGGPKGMDIIDISDPAKPEVILR